jgi:hypothetical protein
VTVYSVYEPPGDTTDLEARAERLAFVKEGFSWPAFFVPPLWLIYHRMWIELGLFVIVSGVLQWAFAFDPDIGALLGWASFALLVLFAIEANDLRGAALLRRDYRLAGVAMGSSLTEAELSFFRTWLPERAGPAPRPSRGAQRPKEGQARTPPAGGGEEVIGFFPRP